jgi:riboflavin synthase
MFTGLVQSLAEVTQLEPVGPSVRLRLSEPKIASHASIGDSIAINGCCLTVVAINGDKLSFDAGEETLSRTTLGSVKAGDRVNVESSLRMGDLLGGHLVSGHIDAVGFVDERHDDADWSKFWFHVPAELTRQMASKGSVVERERFSVALIPHTLQMTTLGRRQVGDRVNIETDILAKYVERQLAWKEK